MNKPQATPIAVVDGGVKVLLRLEGLAVLLLATVCFHHLHPAWGLYFWLFFVPDIGLLGYVAGNRLGCITYNFTHNYILPIGLAIACIMTNNYELIHYSLIWIAHIGFDRAVGYGLKYATGFGNTHLGIVGRRKSD